MAGEDPELDAVARRTLVDTIAAGVRAFASTPGTSVLVIEKSAGDEWRRCVQRVGTAFSKTETMRRAMPGLNPGPGWSSQRAAVDALAHPRAEYAVVAETGEGPLTVVSFEYPTAKLVVVGGGTTFPVPGALADSSLPSGEQAACAVQYVLATVAAEHSLALEHEVSPDNWYGRPLDARREIGPDGQFLSTSPAVASWSAADARYIAQRVTVRQPGGQHPYPEVSARPLGPDEYRRWATQLRGWVQRGGTITVYHHEDPAQRVEAELVTMQLDPWIDPGAPDPDPIPAQAGVRTIVVGTADGPPLASVTVGRDAAGDLRVLRFLRTDEGSLRAAELMMCEAAVRAGGGVSFSAAGAIDYGGLGENPETFANASVHAEVLRFQLQLLDPQSATQLSGVIKSLDEVPGEPVVDPSAVAAAVQRSREAGGDVLVLGRSDPAFVTLQEQAADQMAAAMGPDGTVPPDVDGLWQVFSPPVAEPGRAVSGEQQVAVAVVDGRPVAAAAVTNTGSRYELGAVGAVSGADDALLAAIVDGVYPRDGDIKPLTMFRAEEETRGLAAFGLEVTGVRPVDGDGVEVRLPEFTRQAVLAADRWSGWMNGRDLDRSARKLGEFQQDNGSVVRLDHAVASQRQPAEEAVRALADRARPASEPPPRPVPSLPPVNGNRFTLLARSDQDLAYITFDESADGEIEVVDVAAASRRDGGSQTAARYGLCTYLAERGKDAMPHHRISAGVVSEGVWDAAESRYFVTGMHNRRGDQTAELLRPAPESAPEAAQSREAGQPAETGQSTEPGQTRDAGKGEAPRRQGESDHRRGGSMER
ncbi:hypothetical protein [Kribbella solani]|uniref:Uncharacterized protein n=1 Tax=Kribbella solani TaxID=236067 RepID=A0A841DVN9_9ACTN|nr:hypothetical protein [Kribbella solani]MBB5982692.1 hypothetical protein [Kribbella solani]